uniref:PD-(D/E)XK motif protein n=1 Tax=Shimia sediminis TaxID=2497945 RepID=UPI000F8F729E
PSHGQLEIQVSGFLLGSAVKVTTPILFARRLMTTTDDIANSFSELTNATSQPGVGSILAAEIRVDLPSWAIGTDDCGNVCLLVTTLFKQSKKPPSIMLQNLEIQFQIKCVVERASGKSETNEFTVIRLTSNRTEDRRIFFSVCGSLIDYVGDQPNESFLKKSIIRLANLFRKLLLPPRSSDIGLFGELIYIFCASNPASAVSAWRNSESDKFDFWTPDLRIEVKATTLRQRRHEFSYEQCNFPIDQKGFVASILLDESSRGSSLLDLQELLENQLAGDLESTFKLRSVISETIGNLDSEMPMRRFDFETAVNSLLVFDLTEIPAVRGDLEPGVSGLRFNSDLEHCQPINLKAEVRRFPELSEYFPSPNFKK